MVLGESCRKSIGDKKEPTSRKGHNKPSLRCSSHFLVKKITLSFYLLTNTIFSLKICINASITNKGMKPEIASAHPYEY